MHEMPAQPTLSEMPEVWVFLQRSCVGTVFSPGRQLTTAGHHGEVEKVVKSEVQDVQGQTKRARTHTRAQRQPARTPLPQPFQVNPSNISVGGWLLWSTRSPGSQTR